MFWDHGLRTRKNSSNRIAIIGTDPESILNFRKELILKIKKNGFEPFIIVPDARSSSKLQFFCKENSINVTEVSIDRYSMNIFKELSSIFKIFMALFRIKPDCVITYTVKANLYGTLASIILRTPIKICLITGLGFFFRSKSIGLWSTLITKLYGLIIRKADSIFFQNSDDFNEFKRRGIISDSQNTLMIPGSGVNTKHFYFCQQPSSDSLTFITISRLLKDKGILDLFSLAKYVYRQDKKINFLIVGGTEKSENAISASDLDLIKEQKNIQLIGKVEDVRPFIARSNVLIHPSYHEGMPRSVLEAMSMGRPIITTNAPGCRESIVDNLNGFIVEKGNWRSLNEGVQKFINNYNLIDLMSKQSRKLAREKFDVNIVNKTIIGEIDRLFSQKILFQ